MPLHWEDHTDVCYTKGRVFYHLDAEEELLLDGLSNERVPEPYRKLCRAAVRFSPLEIISYRARNEASMSCHSVEISL